MSAERRAPRPRATQRSTRRFASIVLDRFHELGLETDDEVAEAGGPSSTTMSKIRAARDRGAELPRPRRDAARRIEIAARWAPGSVRRTYDGGDPDELDVRPDVSFAEVLELLDALSPAEAEKVLEHLRRGRSSRDDSENAPRQQQA